MEVQGIGNSQGPEPVRPGHSRRISSQVENVKQSEDKVEISDLARLKAILTTVPEIRVDRVSELRAQIEAGTYETPEKLNAIVDDILRDID